MKVEGMEVLLGCDPEVFVINEKGEYVSAFGLIEGTKEAPQLVEKGMVQVDGMALEFGIDPAATEEEFISSIKTVIKQLQSKLPNNLSLCFSPTALFSEAIIDASPKEALELGCDPDFNGYTLKVNPKPDLTNRKCLRSAGGHVHIGWGKGFDIVDSEFLATCGALSVELDYQLGVPSLGWDTDTQRRQLYGAAGCFRPKPYGMEYRSLSNQWLLKDNTIRFVYRKTLQAVKSLLTDSYHVSTSFPIYNGKRKLSAKAVVNYGWEAVGSAVFKKEERKMKLV